MPCQSCDWQGFFFAPTPRCQFSVRARACVCVGERGHHLNNHETDTPHHLNNHEIDVPTAALNSGSSCDEVGFVLFVLFRNLANRTQNELSLPRMNRAKSLILLRFKLRQVLAYFRFVLLFRVLRGRSGGQTCGKIKRTRAAPQVQKSPVFPVVLSRTRTNRTSSL